MTAQHGANDSTILLRNETEIRIALPIRSNGATRVGLVQSHTPGAPPQRDDCVVIFDSEMAHDRSTGARGTRTIMLETEGSMFFWKIAADRLHGKQQSWKLEGPTTNADDNKVGNR